MLQQNQVSFKTVDRVAQTGDIVVVNYTGTCEGKPITEIAPTAKGLTEQKNFWVETRFQYVYSRIRGSVARGQGPG